MRAEQIFQKVKKHLLKQKKQATDANGLCSYRTNDGLKCAVGCLIEDDAFRPGTENLKLAGIKPGRNRKWVADNTNVHNILLRQALADSLNESGVTATDKIYALLLSLQEVHDMGSPQEWPNRLEHVRLVHLARPRKGDL